MNEPLDNLTVSNADALPESLRTVVRRWWATLDARRGDRAGLRRASTPSAVAFLPAYHALLREFRTAGVPVNPDSAAVMAGVLAHVETDDGSRSFAEQMASKHNDKARVSGLRFRRILAVDGLADLQTSLIRMIHLLDKTASVGDLADSIRWWNDRTKKRWASDYYRTAPNED